MKSIYIATGATSSLSHRSLIPLLITTFQIYATVRNENSPEAEKLLSLGVKFITQNDSYQFKFDYNLWLSTHYDTELLSQYVARAPTLYYSSGAAVPFYRDPGKSPENNYAYEKFMMGNVRGVYVFIAGFYIDDISIEGRGGLHSDTWKNILSDKMIFDYNYWNKKYSVTPMSYAVSATLWWISNLQKIKPNDPIKITSDRLFSRYELRVISKGEQLEKLYLMDKTCLIGDISYYEGFTDIAELPLTYEMVTQACKTAANLFKNVKN